ncbi:MAG: outer membrane protein transport protein [Candidatus Erginobacter occultus]|nr:outer membrane protein transport protein [Candidatus Erginobacter occultus]
MTAKCVRCCGIFFLAVLITLGGSRAGASGFALVEQSGKGLGESFAGGPTDTEDPSSLFYNPAASAFSAQNALGLSFSAIDISVKYKDSGSTDVIGQPLTGGDGGDGGTVGLVPNLYYVQQVADGVVFGFTVNAPFGLATKYPKDWKGRYHGVESDLAVIGISPSAALQIIPDVLSLGAALNVQYADAKLTNAIDFGTILMAGAGTTPQTLDGFADLTGDDWALGYSLGLLYNPTPTTRLGLSYRSKVDHKLSGNVKFDVPLMARGILNAAGMSDFFVNTGGRARVTLPEIITAGVYQELGDDFAVMASVAWTKWSRFKELVVKFDSAQPDSPTEENWEDTLAYRLGVNYFIDERWTLRAGTAYDEGAVKSAYRTPRIPDNDRVWVSLGAGYQVNDDLRVDLSYAHLFIRDGKSELTNKPEAGFLVGEYESSINIFALEGVFTF